jgi:hypothetical protein
MYYGYYCKQTGVTISALFVKFTPEYVKSHGDICPPPRDRFDPDVGGDDWRQEQVVYLGVAIRVARELENNNIIQLAGGGAVVLRKIKIIIDEFAGEVELELVPQPPYIGTLVLDISCAGDRAVVLRKY